MFYIKPLTKIVLISQNVICDVTSTSTSHHVSQMTLDKLISCAAAPMSVQKANQPLEFSSTAFLGNRRGPCFYGTPITDAKLKDIRL